MAGRKVPDPGARDKGRHISAHSGTEGHREPTIDLGGSFTTDVSVSGSFDLKRFRLSSVGKLLRAIPIPTLLVDEKGRIAFANNPCSRLLPKHVDAEGSDFAVLFSSSRDCENEGQLIEKVLAQRVPLVTERIVGHPADRMLGRIHLRAVRVHKVRYILVVIEDLRPRR